MSEPTHPRRQATPTHDVGPCAPQLAQAIGHSLHVMADLNQPRIAPSLLSQQLANALAVHSEPVDTGPQAPPEAVAASRAACAQLAAGDVEDAYLSLLTARDTLAGRHTTGGHPTR